MNQIKIIKREEAVRFTAIQKDNEMATTGKVKAQRPAAERIVADWIGEWREQKRKSAEWNIDYLLRFKSPPAAC